VSYLCKNSCVICEHYLYLRVKVSCTQDKGFSSYMDFKLLTVGQIFKFIWILITLETVLLPRLCGFFLILTHNSWFLATGLYLHRHLEHFDIFIVLYRAVVRPISPFLRLIFTRFIHRWRWPEGNPRSILITSNYLESNYRAFVASYSLCHSLRLSDVWIVVSLHRHKAILGFTKQRCIALQYPKTLNLLTSLDSFQMASRTVVVYVTLLSHHLRTSNVISMIYTKEYPLIFRLNVLCATDRFPTVAVLVFIYNVPTKLVKTRHIPFHLHLLCLMLTLKTRRVIPPLRP
jgi:hypothetical protein